MYLEHMISGCIARADVRISMKLVAYQGCEVADIVSTLSSAAGTIEDFELQGAPAVELSGHDDVEDVRQFDASVHLRREQQFDRAGAGLIMRDEAREQLPGIISQLTGAVDGTDVYRLDVLDTDVDGSSQETFSTDTTPEQVAEYRAWQSLG